MIVGVILAAGASTRMGTPKALLQIGEETFLQKIIRVLHSAQVSENILVLGAYAEQIQPSLSWYHGKIAVNDHWQNGQLSSLQVGIATLTDENIPGVLVCPVDRPMLTQSLIVDLLQGFWKSNKNIIIPTYKGKRGHPVLFGRSMFDALRSAPIDAGARFVVHNYPDEILDVPVEDEGILLNIDTQEEYEMLMRKCVQ
ncbi:MAG: nucleotidyltransferase family protein [Ignavibacteriae bacterium]|nr:nucleotidyltransferase family protein [Ignavibacteriota bacterium]